MTFSTAAYRHDLFKAMGLLPMLAALAAGCAEEAQDEAPLPDDALAPPMSLVLPPHLAAGATVQVVATGATPGATVFLAASTQTGAGPCPPVLGGLCLDITNPRVLGSTRAAANGRATFDVLLPHDAPEGLRLSLQAAQGGAQPAKTAVAPDVVEYPARVCNQVPWLNPTNYATEFEVYACAPLPPGGVCPAPAALSWQQLDWIWQDNTGVPMGLFSLSPLCLETTIEDACCYDANIFQIAIGRPFSVDGQSRVAPVACTDGWTSDRIVDSQDLDPATRARVAQAWTATAQGEHASVAAFARFVLHLSHLGAPADLVIEATRAMSDEIRHARDAFAIASALTGEPVGPGPIDATGALAELSPREILRAAVREGCIAETIAAAQASVARDATTDPAIRAVLDGVAVDEQRHAALSWRFARWMVAEDPTLLDVVQDELARGYHPAPAAADPDAAALRAHGVLSDAEMNEVGRRVFRDVVLVCAQALLGAPGAEATA